MGIASEDPEQVDAARQLAHQLSLPLLNPPLDRSTIALVLNAQRLEIRHPELGSPLFIDFVKGAMGYRRRRGEGRQQPLARAIGLKGGACPDVLDATAGLGRDAFVLASLGCQVLLVEQSPIVRALLDDGLERARQAPETAPVATRMTSIQANAIDWMAKLSAQDLPEVVYLDPMYPERTKSALVKKEMRLLRALVGKSENVFLLLEGALKCARQRVVVKRPRLASPVAGLKPDFAIESKNTRFDVYLTRKRSKTP
ncbi:class I SAM-dependent methyltransferase [Nitrosococcus wardiae]|uniref:class I SAM-dependent methyltransferase n=1 Tax=Nitrosococcus wardiae TaxID=1814290 RepID=UPI00141B20FE|nr:class I SAM-dependent methyltransferase [Nitrosococcus wardiae]